MNKNELKERVVAAIEENKDIIIAAGRKIYSNPEFGYKEFETTKTVSDFFKNVLPILLLLHICQQQSSSVLPRVWHTVRLLRGKW